MKLTAEEFTELLGRPPEQDDLERVNCGLAGLPGHWQCGWCYAHGKPRFMCGCVAPALQPGEPQPQQ